MTLYTTPVIYLYLDRFSRWLGRLWRRFYLGQSGEHVAGVGNGASSRGPVAGADRRRARIERLRRRDRIMWPAAIVPAQYKEMKGWKLGAPRDDFAKGDVVEAVPRSCA